MLKMQIPSHQYYLSRGRAKRINAKVDIVDFVLVATLALAQLTLIRIQVKVLHLDSFLCMQSTVLTVY